MSNNNFMDIDKSSVTDRSTQSQKNSNKKQWYKEKIDSFNAQSYDNQYFGFGEISRNKQRKVNYDLFNGIIDINEFEYVCKPFGAETGELPANFVNRDISSPKIKVLLGMEMNMPFSWKVLAVNEEATTRREQEEFKRISEFVTNQVMLPIRQELELQYQEQLKGQMTPDEKREIQAQIESELKAKTPDEVRKYMSREHQDPADALATQLLEYLQKKENVVFKFNKGWKHALLAGEEIYYLGIVNGEPTLRVVNPLRFTYQKSSENDFIEQSEWCVAEYPMTPSEIIKTFGSSLTNADIDNIMEREKDLRDMSFESLEDGSETTMRVVHVQFKSLRKMGFLSYYDEEGTVQETVVSEEYKLNPEGGDIEITWEYIPEVHEGWKIGEDIYPMDFLRPVPGQHRDLDNLYDCKLSYYGAAYDNMNSETTSAMDRIKGYQYFYNIICYRVELLMASDKGKILLMNVKAVPKSAGINVKQFMYFMESNKIAFYNPDEEGNKNRGNGGAGDMAKEIDMSLATDIMKYIEMAEYMEKRAGETIGVTKAMEGDIANSSAVGNTQQSLTQSSYIIRPYFDLHNSVKANILQGLIDLAKTAYTVNKPRKLSYVLDDLSLKLLNVDTELLDNNTYGIFVTNAANAYEAKKTVEQLAHAALQNQRADLSDVIKVIRSDSIQQAEELLQASEQRKSAEAQNANSETLRMQAEEAKKQREHELFMHENEKELIVLKETERRETEIQKQAILSTGFDVNKDEDNDGTPDVMEIAKFGVDADIKMRKQNLEERKFQQKAQHDDKKIELEKKKLAQKPATTK